MPYWVYSLFVFFFDVDFLTLSFVWFCLQLLQKPLFWTSRLAASKPFSLNKSHTYERTTVLFVCCCCWRKGKRLSWVFFFSEKEMCEKWECVKGGKRVLTARSSRDGWLWGSIRFTTYVSCLMMINMTFEKENTPTVFVFVFRLFIRFRTLLVLFLPRYQSFSFTYHHLS